MHVAVIGVGNMGAAIAGRLLDTGATVALYNRTPARCAPLAVRGARVATSPADAVAGADYVALSLNSADIVETAVFGTDGAAVALQPAQLVVDFSSIDPERTRALAGRLHAATGAAWIDAPLSGGAPAALRGELVLMVGGETADVARAAPLFAAVARRATHLGGSGAGQTVKLVNQILCANAFLAVAEATAFAESQGVDATRIPAALEGGRADSRILQEFMAKMARRDETPTGRIDNMLKDLEAVQRAADAVQRVLPMTEWITALHRCYVAAGNGAADNAAYRRLLDPPTVVVMGPSGCGKSTLARAIAERLGRVFIEGDDLHPEANVAKMARGEPLDDADRAPWLDRVAAAIAAAGPGGSVVACSALKRRYRDRLRASGVPLRFVLARLDAATLASRLASRPGHFMPASLLASQLAALEPPGPDEDALLVENGPVEAQLAAILGGQRPVSSPASPGR